MKKKLQNALNLNSFNNVKNFEQDTIKREKKATQQQKIYLYISKSSLAESRKQKKAGKLIEKRKTKERL